MQTWLQKRPQKKWDVKERPGCKALSMFSAALASGQLGPLMSQFGLPAEAIDAANKGDVEAFAKAMQNNVKSDQKEGEAKEKKDEEEDMSLD